MGFVEKELEHTQYGVSVVKGAATTDVRGRNSEKSAQEVTLNVQRIA